MGIVAENAVWGDSFPYDTEQIKVSNKNGKLRVNVSMGKQGEHWVCFIPSLNISSYGETKEEAKEGLVENSLTFTSRFTAKVVWL